MKKTFLIFATVTTLFSCQKKQDIPTPAPQSLQVNNTVQRDSIYQLSSKVSVGNSLTVDSMGSLKFSRLNKFVDAPSFYESSKFKNGDTSKAELSNNFSYRDFQIFINPKFSGITGYANPNDLFVPNVSFYSKTNYTIKTDINVSNNIITDYYLVYVTLTLTNPAKSNVTYRVTLTTIAKAKN